MGKKAEEEAKKLAQEQKRKALIQKIAEQTELVKKIQSARSLDDISKDPDFQNIIQELKLSDWKNQTGIQTLDALKIKLAEAKISKAVQAVTDIKKGAQNVQSILKFNATDKLKAKVE